MSAIKYKLELSSPAAADFRDILSYTLQIWGTAQYENYRDKIDDALKVLAQNPSIGRKRHGFMVYDVGRHKTFYRIDNASVLIIRILHDRMDVVRHLEN